MKNNFLVSFLVLVLAGALAGSGYLYYKYDALREEYATTKKNLEKNIADKTDENGYILTRLREEEERNNEFQSQISGLANTLGTLDKLSKTDKELLQKYSKVYFLNENYVPEGLSEIQNGFIYDKAKIVRFHSKALPFLSKMLDDAIRENVPLEIVSGYRSFAEQNSLKTSYKLTYGSGANAFSADQGYSEHQLGTALDFTTPKLGAGFESFKTTAQYKWLLENAYEYGFVLSYPESNAYYQFEPWHWRFVGVKLATRMHNEKQNFYDLDQRTIDNYLINIFD